MTLHEKFNAIDIVKGVTVLLIVLFCNLFPEVSDWTASNPVPVLGKTVAGIIFPALIFMTGITIPFSISKRINEGLSTYEISRHIFARAIILITAGVLLVNTERVNVEQTGLSMHIWSMLLIIAFFMVWNRYPENDGRFFTVNGLRLIGLAILVILVFKFRSGTYENNGSLIPGWWEIPGLAGWAYLIGAFTWLALRNSVSITLIIWLFFFGLTILESLGITGFLDPVKPYFGVITGGYIPFIAISGQLAGILLKKYSIISIGKPVVIITISSVVLAATGFLLAQSIFTVGVYGNPGWALIGISCTAAFFALVLWLDEVKKVMTWTKFLRTAGINMMTVYLLPYFFYSLIWFSGINILFYTEADKAFISIAGSVIWTGFILWICLLLVKSGIRLKF
jgi:heparan-alpha-glucosaminide N-acetyltransferase